MVTQDTIAKIVEEAKKTPEYQREAIQEEVLRRIQKTNAQSTAEEYTQMYDFASLLWNELFAQTEFRQELEVLDEEQKMTIPLMGGYQGLALKNHDAFQDILQKSLQQYGMSDLDAIVSLKSVVHYVTTGTGSILKPIYIPCIVVQKVKTKGK